MKKYGVVIGKLHKSAVPVAVRGALNDTAFHMKKTELIKTTQNTFTIRQKNFFKANSKVQPATGFDMRTMKATVGFVNDGLIHRGWNHAVQDLEQQEHGGSISHKAFIAMRAARVGGRGLVRPNMRMHAIKDLISAAKVRSVTSRHKKQRFIRAAIKAKELHGDNAFILGNKNSHNGSQTVFKIQRLNIAKSQYTFAGKGGGIIHRNSKVDIKVVPLYNVKKGRAVTVDRTHFMKRAAEGSAVKLEPFYIKQAQRQFQKYYGTL